MIDAVLYTRVSSAEQLREGFSIAAQEKILRDYCSRNDLRVAAEFSDDETAKTTGRPGFRAMLAYVKAHPGTEIVSEKVDRLYRNLKDYQTLDDLNVEVHFAKEGGRERRNADGKFMHGIRVLMAKKYVENLSEEVKKGMRQKCEEGGWPTWAPLGYVNVKDAVEKKTTGGIVLDPVRAPLVRELFEAAATGRYSYGALVRLADRIQLRGRYGSTLGKSVIVKVIANRAYTGTFTWSGVAYRGKYEPLIAEDLFERAQRAMREGSKPKTRTHTFAYAGIIHCGACGGVLTGDRKKGRYVYYSCRGARSCRRFYAERLFDDAMAEMLRRLVVTPEQQRGIIDAIDRWHGAAAKQEASRATRIRTRLTEIEHVSLSAYEDKLLGKLPEAMWRDLNARWRDQERSLRVELRTLDRVVSRDDLLQAVRAPLELLQVAAPQYLARNAVEKGSLVKTCCSNFIIADGTVSIHLRSPFDVISNFEGGTGWLARVDDYRTAILLTFAA